MASSDDQQSSFVFTTDVQTWTNPFRNVAEARRWLDLNHVSKTNILRELFKVLYTLKADDRAWLRWDETGEAAYFDDKEEFAVAMGKKGWQTSQNKLNAAGVSLRTRTAQDNLGRYKLVHTEGKFSRNRPKEWLQWNNRHREARKQKIATNR